ncbi:MAG: glycosyltransferase, partial [Roseiflexaceae bacterium]
VTFDTPVSREYLGEIGIYARFGSADDLAARLQVALEQRAWAARLGMLGRERAVRELSSERAGPQIEAIYAAALARRRAPRLYGRSIERPDQREARHRAGDEHEEAVERGA